MAEFALSFEHLIEDVFEVDSLDSRLEQLPLGRLGDQAGAWKLALIEAGWQREEFDLLFRECYRANVWLVLRANDIHSQAIADSLFRYASYAHCSHAVRLMQVTLGLPATGKMSDTDIDYLNVIDEDSFYLKFGRGKIAKMSENLRYRFDSSKACDEFEPIVTLMKPGSLT
ncbi:hypothetical protein LRP49_08020 [Enterovibrio sp. ZSDZ35]|uniref:Uncharacterized protein n=1 Tax=Enterovibrio qingdaonensis TaxID=2899818 RepID=A0ABT5QJJ2_9GAMM|nr:hypothetical protein [Enterovibrio sp. ZSDZ35]MDD1781150.1 hypothetical protein [Enterovibrio sp. ZSDZ35]